MLKKKYNKHDLGAITERTNDFKNFNHSEINLISMYKLNIVRKFLLNFICNKVSSHDETLSCYIFQLLLNVKLRIKFHNCFWFLLLLLFHFMYGSLTTSEQC